MYVFILAHGLNKENLNLNLFDSDIQSQRKPEHGNELAMWAILKAKCLYAFSTVIGVSRLFINNTRAFVIICIR